MRRIILQGSQLAQERRKTLLALPVMNVVQEPKHAILA
jgi:hypothetical protein